MKLGERRRRFILWVVVALAVTLPAAWVWRDVLGGRLARLAALGQVGESLWPQAALWTGLLLVGGLHVLWLALSWLRLPPANRTPQPDPGRVASWLGVLRVGQSAPRLLTQALLQLLVEATTQVEQQPPEAVWAAWRAGRLPLPPTVQAYLRHAGQPPTRPRPEATSLEREVEALLIFLEQYVSRATAADRPEDSA